jgi:hypothetical protein
MPGRPTTKNAVRQSNSSRIQPPVKVPIALPIGMPSA